MIRPVTAALLAVALLGAAPAPKMKLDPVPHAAATDVVTKYLRAMQHGSYDDAFAMLTDDGRAYYRTAANLRSVYEADAYRIQTFKLLGVRGSHDPLGRVYFARETAAFRDHAHDTDLSLTATVPIGVVPVKGGGWRIKDPGHPWRAFASDAGAAANGLRVDVKKVSFFQRRIEVVATFTNAGDGFVTVLPYGKSVLRDQSGAVYRIIETKNWALTDKTLFEGLRLAPNARYTGTLSFESPRLDDAARTFELIVSPALSDGGDAPFSVDVANVGPRRG